MHSSNGTSWGSSNVTGFDNTLNWNNITYANGMFIACATGGVPAPSSGNELIIYSTDGINWSNDGVTGVPKAVWRDINYQNGYWIVFQGLETLFSSCLNFSPSVTQPGAYSSSSSTRHGLADAIHLLGVTPLVTLVNLCGHKSANSGIN